MAGRDWKERVRSLRVDAQALALAARDPRVPRRARIVIVVVVTYALSPVDLVPDFIPVVGYLDDALLLPLGIWIALRMVPPSVWRECRALAAARAAPSRPS